MGRTLAWTRGPCHSGHEHGPDPGPRRLGDRVPATLTLTSPAFRHGEAISPQFTCDGEDRSPPLAWRDTPEGTQTFVLIMDDPDAPNPAAPRRVYVHWVLYDIPAVTTHLEPGSGNGAAQAGSRDGKNDGGRTGYTGPCPPIGRHRYFFHLYALDAALGDRREPTKAEVLKAMDGHILAQAELVGTYARGGKQSPLALP